jgi:hypothetical protein
MTIPNHLRTALDRVLEYAIPDEQENYEEARHSASEHIYEDMLALRNWLGPVAPAEPRYSLGINNDDGKCYDIAILRAGKPIATVIVPDTEIAPLLHAGNCFPDLLGALNEMLRCFASRRVITLKERRAARRRSLDVVKKATGGANV